MVFLPSIRVLDQNSLLQSHFVRRILTIGAEVRLFNVSGSAAEGYLSMPGEQLENVSIYTFSISVETPTVLLRADNIVATTRHVFSKEDAFSG